MIFSEIIVEQFYKRIIHRGKLFFHSPKLNQEKTRGSFCFFLIQERKKTVESFNHCIIPSFAKTRSRKKKEFFVLNHSIITSFAKTRSRKKTSFLSWIIQSLHHSPKSRRRKQTSLSSCLRLLSQYSEKVITFGQDDCFSLSNHLNLLPHQTTKRLVATRTSRTDWGLPESVYYIGPEELFSI